MELLTINSGGNHDMGQGRSKAVYKTGMRSLLLDLIILLNLNLRNTVKEFMKRIVTVILLGMMMPAVADSIYSLGVGFDYSTGRYGGTTSTEILYVPVTAKYEMDEISYKLIVPYISITGSGGVIPGMGAVPPGMGGIGRPGGGGMGGGGGTSTVTNSGLGDVIASADYEFYSGDAVVLDAVGKVKFGTADANKGLGTGKNDYSLQLDGSYEPGVKTSIFATLGYKFVGAPEGVTVNNVLYGTVGVSEQLGSKSSAGIMLNYAQSPYSGGSNPEDVMLFVSNKLTKNLKAQASFLKGLSNGSPDYGLGASLTGYF